MRMYHNVLQLAASFGQKRLFDRFREGPRVANRNDNRNDETDCSMTGWLLKIQFQSRITLNVRWLLKRKAPLFGAGLRNWRKKAGKIGALDDRLEETREWQVCCNSLVWSGAWPNWTKRWEILGEAAEWKSNARWVPFSSFNRMW